MTGIPSSSPSDDILQFFTSDEVAKQSQNSSLKFSSLKVGFGNNNGDFSTDSTLGSTLENSGISGSHFVLKRRY